MSRQAIIRLGSLIIVTMLLLGAVAIPISAQGGSPTQQATGNPSGMDDSDELPIYINITGFVQALTSTNLQINGLKILIPAGMTLPAEVAVGKVVSLHGNLRDDDTVTLITIVFGYHLPTSTPAPSPTPLATAPATQQPTLQATEENTVPPTLPAVADCNKPRQSLAVMISDAYRVTYDDAIRLHCAGYSFGTIARAYLVVFAGKDAGKDIVVDDVLVLHLKGRRWSVIIVMLGVQPDSTLVILVFNGGRATVLFNCGSGITANQSVLCVGIAKGSSGQSGAGTASSDDGDKGKGHKPHKDKGDEGDDD